MAEFVAARGARFWAVVLGPARADAEEALRAAGGAPAAKLDLTDDAGLIEALSGAPVLMLEVESAGVDALADALPGAAAAVERAGARVVAAFDAQAIDVVTASLFGRHVQLLCQPSFAERVAALAAAGDRDGDVSGVRETGDDDAGRDIARIADMLARLGQGAEQPAPPPPFGSVEDRRQGYGAEPPQQGFSVSSGEIRRAIRARRLRGSFFPLSLFADPAWDMLLDLFAAELEGVKTSVSSLCIAAGVAPTTALRWITRMTEDGFFERRPDPADRRRVFMGLSTRARVGMLGYVAAVRRAGLAIA